MIKTTGQLMSAIVEKQQRIRFYNDELKKIEEELEELKSTALNYSELMIEVKTKGVLHMNTIVSYTVDDGFIISDPIPYTSSLEKELSSPDKTKLNKGE